MAITAVQKELLAEVFAASSDGVHYLRFQSSHEDNLEDIQHLLSCGYIGQRDKVYHTRLLGLAELEPFHQTAQQLVADCGIVYGHVRSSFKDDPEKRICIVGLSQQTGLPESQVIAALGFMDEAPIWGGRSLALSDADAYVVAGGDILKYKTFTAVLDQLRQWAAVAQGQRTSTLRALAEPEVEDWRRTSEADTYYVDPARLQELSSMTPPHWDLARLIRLCEELNVSHRNRCVMSTAMLLRAIVDHVPPMFGCSSFKEVPANYSGSRSFRASTGRLQESLRHIADLHLHVQIRQNESLPTPTQVDFRADLDVLLSEVARIVKGDTRHGSPT